MQHYCWCTAAHHLCLHKCDHHPELYGSIFYTGIKNALQHKKLRCLREVLNVHVSVKHPSMCLKAYAIALLQHCWNYRLRVIVFRLIHSGEFNLVWTQHHTHHLQLLNFRFQIHTCIITKMTFSGKWKWATLFLCNYKELYSDLTRSTNSCRLLVIREFSKSTVKVMMMQEVVVDLKRVQTESLK